MGYDKAVDSAKLDAALGYTADRIRLKTGGSADLDFDLDGGTGFGNDVDDIEKVLLDDYVIAESSIFDGRIIFPEASKISGYALYGRTGITSVFMKEALSVRSYGFNGCTNITTLVGEKLSYLSNYAVGGCTSLTKIDMGGQTTDQTNSGLAYNNSCNGATNLNTIIIRNKNIVVTLSNINCLSGTPFASGKAGGVLYVPQAFVSQYEEATNWSTILSYSTNSIQAIEGSQYEYYYADGTPIPTE